MITGQKVESFSCRCCSCQGTGWIDVPSDWYQLPCNKCAGTGYVDWVDKMRQMDKPCKENKIRCKKCKHEWHPPSHIVLTIPSECPYCRK
jgi:RecJ-like exonuclease